MNYSSAQWKVGTNDPLPTEYNLEQNYPNPFNPTSTITFDLPSDEFVSLKVFDLLGREVQTLVSEPRKAGGYGVTFDASRLASGVCIYKLQAGGFTATRKMLLAKYVRNRFPSTTKASNRGLPRLTGRAFSLPHHL